MKPIFTLLVVSLFASRVMAAAPWKDHGRLKVTANGHALQHEDGTPFFLLADTAWHLLSLPEAEIEVYLADRAARRFNVVLADFHAASKKDRDADWQLADAVVARAAKHGLYVGIIAGWGSSFRRHSLDEMRECGERLGRRYKGQPNVIYVVAAEFYKIKGRLDGERLTDAQVQAFEQLGQGIRSVDDGHLITIHGFPDKGSAGQPSTYFQRAAWCDFYAVQTHNFQTLIRLQMTNDWSLSQPAKPTLNAEGGYEGCDRTQHPWLKSKDSVALFDSGWGQRFQAYWSVFHGGCGHAYGHDYLWHMIDPQGRKGVLHRPALEAPGAGSMRHLRSLMEPRILTAMPDQTLITSTLGTDDGSDATDPPDLQCATRATDASWAMIYTTLGKNFTVNLSKLTGPEIQAHWFDPRTGGGQDAGVFPARGEQSFDPPGPIGKECDWVLILEGIAKP